MAKDTEKREEKSLNEIKAENKSLYTQLTNKNKDYMFQLNKRLEKLDYSSTKKEYVFNEMLQEIIAAQASSLTARRIYGTVTEQADNILGKNVNMPEDEMEKSPTPLLYLDGALLMGGLFNFINGLSAIRSDAIQSQVGLLQVILNFLLGGLAVLILTKYAPRPGQTKGLLKYGAATVVVIISWVFVMAGILSFLSVINPIMPGYLVLGIGIAALIAKWYFKRKFDIKGTLF